MINQKNTTRRLVMALAAAGLTALLALAPQPGHAADKAAAAPYPAVDVALAVHRVPDSSSYYVLGQPAVPSQANAGFTSNAGFVVTDAGVVVYGALGTPSLGYALIEAIRKVTDKPIKYVVAGHYHADHIYGLQAFDDYTDAVIIAQKQAYSYIGSDTAVERLAQRRVALAPWVNEQTRVVEPDITFTDQLALRLGDTTIKLVFAGPAHSPSDILMMVEPAGILFAGDIVQNHRIPSLDSPTVNTGNWLDGLTTVGKLKPRFVIPGHGQPSTDAMAAIDFTHNYIRYVRDHMRTAVENWVSFEQAYNDTDWSQYEDLPAFDATNKGNAYRVYLDMESTMLE